MKTYIMGDIHGGYKALLQCFERSSFNYEEDELVVLGDVCDGWSETKQCVEELMKVKNLIYVIGNHDCWAVDWGKKDDREEIWISQGGWNTLKSYDFKMPQEHIEFFEKSYLYIWDEETNNLFVHGGINPKQSVESNSAQTLLWDRDLINYAKRMHTREELRAHDTGKEFVRPKITQYNEVFIGHTSTSFFGGTDPLHYCNVWNLDTGGGWAGKLTIMDLETKEYWQSDYVEDLYPGSLGRGAYSKDNPEVIKWLGEKD